MTPTVLHIVSVWDDECFYRMHEGRVQSLHQSEEWGDAYSYGNDLDNVIDYYCDGDLDWTYEWVEESEAHYGRERRWVKFYKVTWPDSWRLPQDDKKEFYRVDDKGRLEVLTPNREWVRSMFRTVEDVESYYTEGDSALSFAQVDESEVPRAAEG